MNKVDKIKNQQKIEENLISYKLMFNENVPVIRISAKTGRNIDTLIDNIYRKLPNGDLLYPEDVLTDEINTLISDNNIEKLYFDPLTTLSSENKASGKDYISIMSENLNVLRQELYEEQK